MIDDSENFNNINSKTTLIDEGKKKTHNKVKKDPLLVQTVNLHEDIYALTWNSLRKESWSDLKVHEVEIFLTPFNIFTLKLQFICFILIVLTTVGVLLYESFITDAYNDATWPIIILRITLVAFAQKKLEPEVYQGLSLFRFTNLKSDHFSHPHFSRFVAFCQFSIAGLTFISIFLFVCMANEALELIMNFAGLAVISELDDWMGEKIMSQSIHKEFEEDSKFSKAKLDLEGLNDRMSLHTKMCLIGEDMEIEDDQNQNLGFFGRLSSYIPWILLPFLTIPCESLLLKIQTDIFGELHDHGIKEEIKHKAE